MADKHKRHNKKEKTDISQDDKDLLYLLNIQAQAISIYLTADMFFYEFAIILLESTYIEDLDKDFNKNILLVNGCGLSLIASVILSELSFTAYEHLHHKDLEGKLDFKIWPEKGIAISSIFTILLFFVNLIGAIGLYNRVDICQVEVSPYWVRLLSLQVKAYEIRILADYLTLTATEESVELIKSKYAKSKRKMQDPDIPAVMAAILYLIQRVMLFYVSYEVYFYTLEECKGMIDLAYLEPNRLPILGSIFGITADIIALRSFVEIYQRNIDRPIFGR